MLVVAILELGDVASEVTLWDICQFRDFAGKCASAERGVCDDGDVELGAGFGDVVFEDVERPEG